MSDLKSARNYAHGKDSPVWVSDYTALLNEIDDWSLNSEALDAFYYEKTTLLLTMIEMPESTRSPSGDEYLRDYYSNQPKVVSESRASASFLRFITSSTGMEMRSRRPMLWYAQVRRLLDFINDYEPPQKLRVLESLRRTDDPLLQLCADFEQVQNTKGLVKENPR